MRRQAFVDGYIANCDGMGEDSCKYTNPSFERQAWMDGFNMAQKHENEALAREEEYKKVDELDRMNGYD